MKIISSLRTGFTRVCRARNAVLFSWFLFFLLAVLLVFPLHAALNNAFGSSMITERLAEGLDIEVFADLGGAGLSLFSVFTNGYLFTFLVAFLINAFVSAGLFGVMRKDSSGYSAMGFFRAAGGNFLPFLVITFVLTIAFLFFVLLFVIVPISAGGISDGAYTGAIRIASASVLLLLVPVFLLVADYSRAGKAGRDDISVFAAIGFGLNLTLKIFRRSYVLMVLLLLVQTLLLLCAFLIIPLWKPLTGGGVLLVFLVTQMFVLLRLFLKSWRYASVTSMMENPEKPGLPETTAAGTSDVSDCQNCYSQ